MIETPRSIATDGGWRTYPTSAVTRLAQPYRHHLVVGRATLDAYVLPLAGQASQSVAMGMGVPLGTEIWVHNVNGGGHPVLVASDDFSQIWTVVANRSMRFLLFGNQTVAGQWRSTIGTTGRPNGRGPSQPSSVVLDIIVRNSRNNLDVLAESVRKLGYDGTSAAIVRVTVLPNVVIGSSQQANPAVTVGGDTAVDGINWAAGSICVLKNQGTISGKGGDGGGGGIGGTGAAGGTAGEAGGLGLRCPIETRIENLGTIQGGGGGGGGGDGMTSQPGVHGAPGGGGAGANVDAGGVSVGGRAGVGATGTLPATRGELFQRGNGGWPTAVAPNVGGGGAVGGNPGAAGASGNTFNNTANSASGLGGAAGPAISRAAGATVTFIATGTVTGAQVVA